MDKAHAHVCPIILDLHLVVDPNAQLVQNARATKPASILGARIHVPGIAELMLTAEYLLTVLFVHVDRVTLVIRLPDVMHNVSNLSNQIISSLSFYKITRITLQMCMN